MLSLLLRPRLYRSFRQLDLGPAPELNSWCLIPCAHTSTLGKRMLATSTEKIPKRAPHIDSPSSSRLRTLRPERLSIVGQEVIDLSGKTASLVPTLIDGRVLRLQCHYTRKIHLHGRNRYLRYPENTRGVFYYHNPPDGPEFYAGMRFRICDSAAEFEHGRDLLDPRGDVWGPKILELVKHKELQGFLSLLRAENLIDEDLINDIKKLDYLARAGRHVGNVHYSLFEPFYMNVAQSKSQLTYVTRAKLVRLHFPGRIFTVQTHPASSKPLTGSIKVQFELSDLPEHKELGPTLVIRVLDVVEPIAVDPLYTGDRIPPVPVPGTLLHRNARGRKKRILHIPLKDQPMADDLLELLKMS